jgi:histidyl-tRNA synthetase
MEAPAPDLYVISRGEAAACQALLLARQGRQAGLVVERDASGAAFGKQFKRADKSGAPWAAVLGEQEAAEAVVVLKHLRDSERQDRRLPIAAVLQELLGKD